MKIAEYTLSGLSGSNSPATRRHTLGAEFSLGELAASDGASFFTRDAYGPYGDVENGAWEALFVDPTGASFVPKPFVGANPWDPPEQNAPISPVPEGLPWSPMPKTMASLSPGANIDNAGVSSSDRWVDKVAKIAAATQGDPEPATAAISPSVLKNLPDKLKQLAVDVANGGFVGGVVGEKAKLVREKMLLDAEKAKHLDQAADEQFTPSEAARLRGESNRVLADVLEGRARVERFRVASLMKVYELIKNFEAERQQKLANFAAPDMQYRHLAEAKANARLAAQAKAKYQDLLTKPLNVPGLDQAKREASYSVDERFEIQREAGTPGIVYGQHEASAGAPLPTIVKGVAHPPVTETGFPAEQRYATAMTFIDGLDGLPGSLPGLPKSVDAAVADGSAIVGAGATYLSAVSNEVAKVQYQKFLDQHPRDRSTITVAFEDGSKKNMVTSDATVDETDESGHPTGKKLPGVKIDVMLATNREWPNGVDFTTGSFPNEFPGTTYIRFIPHTTGVGAKRAALVGGRGKTFAGVKDSSWAEVVLPYTAYAQTYVVFGKTKVVGFVGASTVVGKTGTVTVIDPTTGKFVDYSTTDVAKQATAERDCRRVGGTWANGVCTPPAAAEEDNTTLYIVGGVAAAAILGGGAWYFIKKRRAAKGGGGVHGLGYYGRRRQSRRWKRSR